MVGGTLDGRLAGTMEKWSAQIEPSQYRSVRLLDHWYLEKIF